jgi:hypothetical protein
MEVAVIVGGRGVGEKQAGTEQIRVSLNVLVFTGHSIWLKEGNDGMGGGYLLYK